MQHIPDLPRLLEFQRLLLRFAQTDRQLEREHGLHMRPENDTEHSYNLAMTAWYIVSYFSELDRDTVIRLALVHDLVEVHAGDTDIYGSAEEIASKPAREQAAAEQLRADWPDFAELHQHIATYESRNTPEARFVYALDKIMPMMLIYISGGHTWKKRDITVGALDAVKRHKVAVSPEIQPYYEALYRLLIDSPHMIQQE